MDIATLKRKFNHKQGEYNQIKKNIQEKENEIKKINNEMNLTKKALYIARTVGLETQQTLSDNISMIVNNALQSVFNNPYELKVEFVERRNKTECDLLFERNRQTMEPLNSSGHGAADVASFALRIICWSMFNTSPVLILDEPFKHLKGIEQNKKAIQMVKEISNELGLQIIMVSDERAAKKDIVDGADKVFYVYQENEISNFKEIKGMDNE